MHETIHFCKWFLFCFEILTRNLFFKSFFLTRRILLNLSLSSINLFMYFCLWWSFFDVFFCVCFHCRELNELRKPTSDNVEILRFFKYMRAARDGQDGKNCHNIHKKCSSFTDTEQPAMLTTYNDINKLVHARNMQ